VQGSAALVREELPRPGASAAGEEAPEDVAEDPEEYAVDNSELQHRGPGVLYRRSKSQSDTIGKDQFAAWGSTVKGVSAGEDWVKVGERYLPTKVRGTTVLVKTSPSKLRMRTRTAYVPTQFKSLDGTWIPANVTGRGSKPHTYNVIVISRTLAPYTIPDVPEEALMNVEPVRVRERAPTTAPLVTPAAARVEEEDRVHLTLKVQDFQGRPLELKFEKALRLQKLMLMACERASILQEDCEKDVRFIYHGRDLNAEDTYDAVDMRSGDTVYMLRRKRLPFPK